MRKSVETSVEEGMLTTVTVGNPRKLTADNYINRRDDSGSRDNWNHI